ncbi:PTS fructose transporter subunit IIA [bacterium F11]|nr:PTS fructose transporter subunit IIA [bacterium F11]
MKVLDFLELDSVQLDLQSPTKEEAIVELCRLLETKSKIKKSDAVITSLMERERLGSTGIGQGVAIPHGKSDSVDKLVAALGVSKKGVNFEALDGEPVHLIFLLVAPPDSSGTHLKALARISRLLKDKFFRQALKEAKTREEVQRIIQEEDDY